MLCCAVQARAERGSLTEALATASGELARYREATGRSLDSLEAERSSAAALATRSKAQVRTSPAGSNHCLGPLCRAWHGCPALQTYQGCLQDYDDRA